MIERGAIYTPLPSDRQMALRLASGKWILTFDGMEALCSRCNEYWPADTQFYDRHQQVGLSSICKCCRAEEKQSKYIPARVLRNQQKGE